MRLYSKLSTQQWIIAVLTLVSAGIHLSLGFGFLDWLLILNGFGYLGLLGLYFVKFDFLPVPRNWVRWALAGYAVLTLIIYTVMQVQSAGEFVSPLGIVTGIIEIALAFLLAREKV